MESTATTSRREQQVFGGQSVALSLLMGIRSSLKFTDRIHEAMGYVSGLLLLLLGLFITYQVIARKVGITMAPGTDQMSGYAMALAATWAFSYALRTGSHVRIDVLLPFMPPKVRAFADWAALGSIMFLTCITSWKVWIMVIKSWQIDAITNSYPLTPLWIPQGVVAVGFSLLGITCLQMMVSMWGEWLLPQLHKAMGGTETRQTAIPEVAGGADGHKDK